MATSGPVRTLAFLFSDLRGYTSFIDTHGDAAAAGLVREYRQIVRAAIAELGGREVGTEGDSFFVAFESVSAAVRCGGEILGRAGAQEPPIRAGVGIHAGEAASTDLGFVAGPVNVAARLCAVARAGDVVVTDTVRHLVRTALEVPFQSMGVRRLKGVAEPVAAWRYEVPGAARSADHGLPSRRFGAVMAAGYLLGLVAAVLQALMANGRLGPEWNAAIAPGLGWLVMLFLVPVVIVNTLATGLILLRSAAAVRWCGRLAVGLALIALPASVAYFGSIILQTRPLAAAIALMVTILCEVLGWSLGCYGLVRRRPWAVPFGFAIGASLMSPLSSLPVGLAAVWAVSERRENVLY